MNKLLTKIVGVALGATMAVGVGVGVAVNNNRGVVDSNVEATAASYTITFQGNNSESTTISTSTTAASITGSSSYVTGNVATATKAYGATSGGVKLGTSSAAGTLKINLSESGQVTPTSVVVNAKLYNSTKSATLGFNGSTKQSVSSDYADITFDYTTAITYIQIDVTKYVWVKSVTVNYESTSEKTLDSIALSGTYPTSFYTGDTFSYSGMTVTATYSDTTTADVTNNATFSGYNMSTAGNQTVTVSYTEGGVTKTATYSITVSAPVAVTKVELNSNAETLDIGGKVALTATVSPNDATNKGISWETSNENVATVNNGVVTALAGGTATITAKSAADATKFDTCVITVDTADVVLSYNNSPFDAESAPSSSTAHTKTLDGIEYQDTYGYKYSGASAISFNRSYEAYLQNNTGFSHYISKIIVAYTGSTKTTAPEKVTMYAGSSSGSTSNTVTKTMNNDGDVATYTFPSSCQYFKFVQSTTGTYVNIKSFNIFFGNEVREVSSIAVKTAPTKTSYLSGQEFNPAGLVITLTYSTGTPATEDVAYSNETKNDFSFSPSTITSAGNVTISYAGKTCNQAVTMATVSSVDSVASHPESVYVNGTIAGTSVTLNVTYSNGDTDVVNADHVSVDTSSVAASVLATAWYTEEESGNLKATFNVAVLYAPISVSDNIDLDFTGVSGTSYTSWSDKTSINGAKYSGNCAGGNNSIQLNNSSTSGLYTSVSAGKLYSVSVTWNSNTTNDRKISVYGSNTAFASISTTGATKLGEIKKGTSTSVVDEDFEYDYLLITGGGSAVYIDEIVVTWKVPATDNPMTGNPTLSLGKPSISVGKTTTLTVSTTPVDSDEILNVVSGNPAVATVTGSGKSYIVTGVAVGSTTITVTGKQSGYSNSIGVSVVAASKTYEDKILTPDSLGISAYDKDPENPGTYSYDDANYSAYYVMKSSGFQFHNGDGYLTNAEELYSNAEIKSVTLIMNSGNSGTIAVYEGTSTNPSTPVSPVTTYAEKGVNTYQFNGTSTYFKVKSSSGVCNVDKIIVELADDANSVLEEARLAALAILTDLSGLCGDGGTGVVTQSDWNTLAADLAELDLSEDAKLFLKNAPRILLNNLSQGGAEIENAMAHYDLCVSKFGYTDVLGISNVASANPSLNNGVISNTTATATVIIVSVIVMTTLCGYFLLRKRKEER